MYLNSFHHCLQKILEILPLVYIKSISLNLTLKFKWCWRLYDNGKLWQSGFITTRHISTLDRVLLPKIVYIFLYHRLKVGIWKRFFCNRIIERILRLCFPSYQHGSVSRIKLYLRMHGIVIYKFTKTVQPCFFNYTTIY